MKWTQPSFEDLRLLTRGPQSTMEIGSDTPVLMPAVIDIIEPVMQPAKQEGAPAGG